MEELLYYAKGARLVCEKYEKSLMNYNGKIEETKENLAEYAKFKKYNDFYHKIIDKIEEKIDKKIEEHEER